MAFFIYENCSGCGLCKKICPSYAVTGDKKNLHVIDDDRCIECGACGKVCPVGAVLDPFGVVAPRVKKKLWEKPKFDMKKCMACVICVDACPADCISLGVPEGKDPHAYPYLAHEQKCVACGFCALECPVEAVSMIVPEFVDA